MTIHASRSYLEKHRLYGRQVQASPDPDLGLVVVIPCHGEPHLIQTLDSLVACTLPACAVEVIVVVNAGSAHPEAIHAQNAQTLEEVRRWQSQAALPFRLNLLDFPQLPPKHAGVGLARKLGMDEAVDRLEQAGNPHGVIVCLDADSQVEPQYLQALHQHFSRHPRLEACSLYFEHPLSGTAFPEAVYQGITYYELFIRYYIQGLRYAGYPYAFHTIGSSMAVRSSAYQKYGGMNRRKAGEDFYFLHKIIPQGHFNELTTTRVIPSPRPSDKVPFGTGRAITQWLAHPGGTYLGYHIQTFVELKAWLDQVPQQFRAAPAPPRKALDAFLAEQQYPEHLAEIRRHVASEGAFVKRFYQWFDALKVLQFVHFARDHCYPDQPLVEAARELIRLMVPTTALPQTPEALLLFYRQWQRNTVYEKYPPERA